MLDGPSFHGFLPYQFYPFKPTPAHASIYTAVIQFVEMRGEHHSSCKTSFYEHTSCLCRITYVNSMKDSLCCCSNNSFWLLQQSRRTVAIFNRCNIFQKHYVYCSVDLFNSTIPTSLFEVCILTCDCLGYFPALFSKPLAILRPEHLLNSAKRHEKWSDQTLLAFYSHFNLSTENGFPLVPDHCLQA